METQVLTSAYRNHGNFQYCAYALLFQSVHGIQSPHQEFRMPYRSVTKRGWFITAPGFYRISTGQKQMASAELWPTPLFLIVLGSDFQSKYLKVKGLRALPNVINHFKYVLYIWAPIIPYICISPCTTLLSIPEVDTSHYRPMLGFQNQKHSVSVLQHDAHISANHLMKVVRKKYQFKYQCALSVHKLQAIIVITALQQYKGCIPYVVHKSWSSLEWRIRYP